MSAPRLHFTAGEASGDLLARETIEAIRHLAPQAEITGVGGVEMAGVGVAHPTIDTAPLAVLGLLEGLAAYRYVVRLADAVAADIIATRPDAAVLVDSWGFTLRVAQRVRKAAPQIRLIKLVGPQVWATRPGRARTLAGTVDHLLCVFPFEEPYYAAFGLPTTVIGHPALGRTAQGDGEAFRRDRAMAMDQPVLLILPGSRRAEIHRVAPALVTASQKLRAEIPELSVFYGAAESVQALFQETFPDIPAAQILTSDTCLTDAMAAADVALACSGTVTLEAAMQGLPVVAGYKVGWPTWAIGRALFLLKTPYISLLNIAVGEEVSPEFVQTRLTPDRLAEAARALLVSPERRAVQLEAQARALSILRHGDDTAAEMAARAILDDVCRTAS